jgi:hypothetical protein
VRHLNPLALPLTIAIALGAICHGDRVIVATKGSLPWPARPKAILAPTCDVLASLQIGNAHRLLVFISTV